MKIILTPNKEKLKLFLIGSILFLAPIVWLRLKLQEYEEKIKFQVPLDLQILFWVSVGIGILILYFAICLVVEERKKIKTVIPRKKRIILALGYLLYAVIALSIWWSFLRDKLPLSVFFYLLVGVGIAVLFLICKLLKIPIEF